MKTRRTYPPSQLHRRVYAAAVLALALSACSEDYMASGQAQLSKGNTAGAVIEFRNAVREQPSALAPRLALADALLGSFDLPSAEQNLRKAVELGGDKNVLVLRVASLMLDGGMADAVVREYKDVHLSDPGAESELRALVALSYLNLQRLPLAQEQLQGVQTPSAASQVVQAQVLLAQGQRKQALELLQNLTAEADAPWWSQRALGRTYTATGQPAKALVSVQRATELAPWHRGLRGEYAEALLGSGQTDAARAIHKQLQKQAPSYFWTHYLNAALLARDGRIEDSHAAALKVLSAVHDHLPANLLAASAELQQGDLLMAENRLKKIARNQPNSLVVLQMLTAVQLQLGDAKSAQESLGRGLALAPDDAQFLFLQADAQIRRGDVKAAGATLERLLARHPEHAGGLLRLSELRLREGNRKASGALLDRAAEVGQNQPEVRDRIIAVALRAGDVQRVKTLADHALQTLPQDPQSHLLQAIALGSQKDLPGARQALLSALDLKPSFDTALLALAAMPGNGPLNTELRKRYAAAVADPASTARTYGAYVELLRRENAPQQEVLSVLEKGVAAHPDATGLRTALVQQHLRTGHLPEALRAAQTGSADANAPAAAQALLAQTYERAGQPEQATATYRQLVTSHPQHAQARLHLARLQSNAGQQAEATKLLRGLMQERPFDSTAFVELAQDLATTDTAQALAVARQLGQHAPHQQSALLLEGDVLARANQIPEALGKYQEAARAGAEPAASLRRVSLLERTGRSAESDTELNALARRFAGDVTVALHRAQLSLARGEASQAAAQLASLAQKHPQDVAVLNELAWAQTKARQPEALATARKALALLPDDARVLDTLGMAQAQAGQRNEAIASLRAASALASNPALPRLHLAEQLVAAGEHSAAATALQGLNEGQFAKTDQAMLAQLRSAVQR